MTYTLISVEKDSRKIWLTTKVMDNGRLLGVISKGSPQKGDKKIDILEAKWCEDRADAEAWFDLYMATYRAALASKESLPLPEGLTPTELAAVNGQLVVKTKEGVDFVPPKKTLDQMIDAAIKGKK